MHLPGGNCHDAPQGRTSIENIGDSYSGIPYLMDRAYEGDKTRELCQSFGHKPVVPPKKNRINPWEYDHELYKRRNIIERLFRWLKAFRRVCTRYDKLDYLPVVRSNRVRPHVVKIVSTGSKKLPLPRWGRGSGGEGAKRKTKGMVGRRQRRQAPRRVSERHLPPASQEAKPPAGYRDGGSSQCRPGSAPGMQGAKPLA